MKEIFISYSHFDEDLRKELDVHLSGLKRQGLINTWHDRKIAGGSEIDSEINKYISTADIILLLISPHFIASDYCYNIELSTALKRHEEGSVTVLPVILRPCDWHDLPFGKLLASPPDGKPVIKYPTLDDGFLEVVTATKVIIRKYSESIAEIPVLKDHILEPKEQTIIRSSNLRVKKEFSDEDKDKFETESFEYIARFFENSLAELEKRNDTITCRCRRIDLNSFEASVYINGQQKSLCTIAINNIGFSGITFSYGKSKNSINESMHVENDGYVQYLTPMGFQFVQNNGVKKFTMEGAAEYYWELLIRNLQ